MGEPGPSQRIAQARALIAQRRGAEARALLAPLQGLGAAAGPVGMLVGYSFLVDGDANRAVAALNRVPTHVEPTLALGVGRLLLTCGAGLAALERFRLALVQQPGNGEAAAMSASAMLSGQDPRDALRWSTHALCLGAGHRDLATTRLRALVDLGRHVDAANEVAAAWRTGLDADQIVAAVVAPLIEVDGRIGDVVRLCAALDPRIRRLPNTAVTAATAAFIGDDIGAADALLAAADRLPWAGIALRHAIALERGEVLAARHRFDDARRRILEDPGHPEATIGTLALALHTVDHDSAWLLRWAGHGAVLAGSGMDAVPDGLFHECIRWKRDFGRRDGRRALALSHVFGALAAEAAFGGPVAVRPGPTHARIEIAGRILQRRLTSSQVRRSVETLFSSEPGLLRWFAGFHTGDVLVDIGANCGWYGALAAGLSGCRVVAIASSARDRADLEHNVAINRLEDRVTAIHASVCDADGMAIDDLVASGAIAFPTRVRIDADGLEEPIIRGMRAVLSDRRVKSLRMSIEWQDAANQTLVDSVCAQGFSVRVADEINNLLFERLPGR